MKLYLDTSVLASLYFPELHTQAISDYLTSHQASEICISRLVQTEFYSVLAIKQRTKELDKKSIKIITNLFEHHLATVSYEVVFISNEVYTQAIKFLSSFKTKLRTLDALHLACCKVIKAKMLTADKVLAASAKKYNINCELI